MFLTVVTAMPLSSHALPLPAPVATLPLPGRATSQFSTALPNCATSSSDTLQSVTLDEKSIYRATCPPEYRISSATALSDPFPDRGFSTRVPL